MRCFSCRFSNCCSNLALTSLLSSKLSLQTYDIVKMAAYEKGYWSTMGGIHDLVAAEDFEYQVLWFAGIYVRPYSKIIFGKSHFKGGKKIL